MGPFTYFCVVISTTGISIYIYHIDSVRYLCLCPRYEYHGYGFFSVMFVFVLSCGRKWSAVLPSKFLLEHGREGEYERAKGPSGHQAVHVTGVAARARRRNRGEALAAVSCLRFF